MKESNMAKADLVTSVVFIAFGISVLLISIGMPRLESQNVNPYSVPGIVPGFLGAVIAVLGFVLLLRSIIRKGYRFEITGEGLKAWFRDDSARRLFLTLGLTLLYALVFIGRLPYPVGTILFIFAFVVVFEFRRGVPLMKQKRMLLGAALVSVISGLSIWIVFRYLFLVSLP
jgi:putative tricarboxylic transport membrane protein